MPVKVQNPVTITIDAGESCEASAVSNASYHQYMTITDGSNTYVFDGAGENAKMMVNGSQDIIALNPSDTDRTISVLFEYTTWNGGPRQTASVNQPNVSNLHTQQLDYRITSITSEDSTDNDNNDTFATITCISVNK